jgi:hypothetical protein
MRYGSCYLSKRRYVKHVPVTGARAARSPGHVRFNVGQKTLRRSLVYAPIQIARPGRHRARGSADLYRRADGVCRCSVRAFGAASAHWRDGAVMPNPSVIRPSDSRPVLPAVTHGRSAARTPTTQYPAVGR